jgi:predicted metalloprotease with PDZ domain
MTHSSRLIQRMCIFATLSIISLIAHASYGQQPTIRYTLGMSKPSTHLFEVEILMESLPSEPSLDLILPVWRPGYYMIFDFASGVQDFAAFDGEGTSLRWAKTDKSTWHVETNRASAVHVRYNVYANESTMRTRGLNDEHAYVDGTAVFMYVHDYRQYPVTLLVHPYQGWHVTTALHGVDNRFTASSYDEFVDRPLEIGIQQDFSFQVDGVPHLLSMYGDGNWNPDTLLRDFTTIVREVKAFWGEFPYTKYVFLVHCMAQAAGATEHGNSTIIQTTPFIFRDQKKYSRFLQTVLHEYFHTWNVKQLRPKGITPYDFTKENYSREFWIAEGTTSYYDELLMVRSGFMSAGQYLDSIAAHIRDDRQRPGNLVQPVSEASFDVWVKHSRGTEQRYNAESDIYSKGANVSLLLDLRIRKRSSNKCSLDDVLRTMYKRFPSSGEGYTSQDFQSVAEECAGSSLRDFFDKYVYGTAPLPWEESLLTAGIELTQQDTVKKPWVGFTLLDVGGRSRITTVVTGSPAEDAGIEVGDELLALNAFRINASDFVTRINEMTIGESVTLTVFRNDKLRTCRITLGHAPTPTYALSKIKNPTPDQRAIFESWLKTAW